MGSNQMTTEQVAQIILAFLGLLGGLGALARVGIILLQHRAKRVDQLADQLIEAKTEGLREKINSLTLQYDVLLKEVNGLRSDLETERTSRAKEEERAQKAEKQVSELERKVLRQDIIIDTLYAVIRALPITLPEDRISIVVSSKASTDDVTEAAQHAVSKLTEG